MRGARPVAVVNLVSSDDEILEPGESDPDSSIEVLNLDSRSPEPTVAVWVLGELNLSRELEGEQVPNGVQLLVFTR